MNWDWDKLKEQQKRQPGGPPRKDMPDFDKLGESFKGLPSSNLPIGKLVVGLVILFWLASGIYMINPNEVGIVLQFRAYDRQTEAGLHYHLPYPIESVIKIELNIVRSIDVGFRSMGSRSTFDQGQIRPVIEEAQMLTGDENIVDVQFVVQYRILDPVQWLFNVRDPESTIKNAAEAAMREVIGSNKIDAALTDDKVRIQTDTLNVLQKLLNLYKVGVTVIDVRMQDVYAPKEVRDAFKDVASAREDKSRFINEAEAYRNDILPKARGEAAIFINRATAYKESVVRKAKGDASRFLSVLKEFNKAKDVTQQRLYLETMEKLLSNPEMQKYVLPNDALKNALPLLRLDDPAISKSERSNALNPHKTPEAPPSVSSGTSAGPSTNILE